MWESLYEWDADEAEEWFEYAGYKARRPKEPLDDSGTLILAQVTQAFAFESDPSGRPWDSLTEKYRDWKVESKGYSEHPILTLRWQRGSRFTLRHEATSRRAVRTVQTSDDGGYLIYQPETEYADVHQYGLGKVPARPFLDPDLLGPQIAEVFAAWLDEIKSHNPRRRGGESYNPIGQRGWL